MYIVCACRMYKCVYVSVHDCMCLLLTIRMCMCSVYMCACVCACVCVCVCVSYAHDIISAVTFTACTASLGPSTSSGFH